MASGERSDQPAQGARLCRLDEIPDGDGREFVLGDGPWAFRMFVVRRGDAAWGYVNRCPHQNLTLNLLPDRFAGADKRFIVCVNHGARFRFDDGFCVTGPCAGESLEPVSLELREGVVFVGS